MAETTTHDVAAEVDEPAAARSTHLESSIMATGEAGEGLLHRQDEAAAYSQRESQRANANRTSTRSSSEEEDDGPAIAVTSSNSSKRSHIEEATISAAAASSPSKKRPHLKSKVAASDHSATKDFLKTDNAEDHTPVRKARVSVRTRSDSTTVSELINVAASKSYR